MCGSLPVGNKVVTRNVGQSLGGEREFKRNVALMREIAEEVSIFGRHRGGGNRVDTLFEVGGARMWQTEVSASNGPDQHSGGPQSGAGVRTAFAIHDRRTIGGKSGSFGCQFLVKLVVEQQNFA